MITIQRVKTEDLPGMYRGRKLTHAYRLTDVDGEFYYVDTEEDAAALAAKLHRDDLARGADLGE